MHRLTRYVLSELITAFLITLMAMTAFVLLGIVANEAVREGLGPSSIARLLPFSLPMALRFTIPGTMLFATCSVFGRMSANNEITAIKSLGISPMAVLRPALTLAVIVSCLAVWLNDIAVSWGSAGINRVVLQSIEQIIYGRLRTQRSYSNQRGLSINVKDVVDDQLIRPTLSITPGDGSPSLAITADRASLHLSDDAGALIVHFENMQVDGEKVRGDVPGTFDYAIPLSLAARKRRAGDSPSDTPMNEIGPGLRDLKEQISRLEQRQAAEAAYALALGEFAQLHGAPWDKAQADLDYLWFRYHRLAIEPWRRWASGFGCFCFVLVGAPLAILLRTADFWTSFGTCFLPILIVYYPLFMTGVDRAKAGAFPPFAVWAGNAMLLIVGLLLIRRVMQR